MFQSVTRLEFASIEVGLPAFVTIAIIPLTLSITQGILWGFLLHALLHVAVGRGRAVGPMMWSLAAVAALLLAVGH